MNLEEKHSWKELSESIICIISIDYFVIKRILEKETVVFLCNSVKDISHDYGRIRYIVEEILKGYAQPETGLKQKSLYYTLWECIGTVSSPWVMEKERYCERLEFFLFL